MKKGLVKFDETNDDEVQEAELEIKTKIKSPLSTLHYNLNSVFTDNYPAKMPMDFARDMLELYTDKNDIVWDGCGGSGTVARAAARLGRRAIYSDVNEKAVDLAIKLAELEGFDTRHYYCDDARTFNVHGIFAKEKVDLVLSSLPFGLNIIGDKNHYSEHKNDISNSKDIKEFLKKSGQIIKSYYDNLKPDGLMILDSRDRFYKRQTIWLVLEFAKLAQEIGFEPITRFYYELIPYRQMTYLDKPTGKVKAMPSAMDVIVMRKPSNEKLF
ncbi:MAG: DNA methyltransferase [Nitrosotalea sp.]